ncbi:hypothetical protein V2J09_005993 [Rumex salicifolius]
MTILAWPVKATTTTAPATTTTAPTTMTIESSEMTSPPPTAPLKAVPHAPESTDPLDHPSSSSTAPQPTPSFSTMTATGSRKFNEADDNLGFTREADNNHGSSDDDN